MSSLVPDIDIRAFYDGDAAARRALAQAVDRACRDVGFLVVSGHRVDPALLQRTLRQAEAFFDQDEALKRSAAPPDRRVRGYTPMGAQALAASRGDATPPDLFERFRMGQPCDARRGATDPANVWPLAPAGFRETLEACYAQLEALARDLMAIFALALDLPEHWFDATIDRHISSLCLNHYPAQQVPPLPGQLRSGAHTDYGSLTMVAPTPGPGGLEVLGADGRWHAVTPPPGSFAVNIGDLMAQWTNDRWVSTLHRVANPPQGPEAMQRRIAIVFFHQPNADAEIACLPNCHAADNPPRYAPITSGEHLRTKIERAFAGRAEPQDAPPGLRQV